MPPALPSRRSRVLALTLSLAAGLVGAGRADELPLVANVDLQPLAAQVRQVVEALEMLGQPLPAAVRSKLDRALATTDAAAAVRSVQEILDPLCLVGITVNPESRVKATQGPAPPVLV